MATAKIQHVYDCDEEAFWTGILFNVAFNRKLFLDHLKFKQWEVVKFDETDSEIRREIVSRPVTGDLPRAIAKIVGDNLGFREHGVFDKKTKRYKFNIEPNRMADKLFIDGEIYVEARGEGRCERFVQLNVEAKIFGIGKLVENRIIADTRESYDKGFAFGRTYMADRDREK